MITANPFTRSAVRTSVTPGPGARASAATRRRGIRRRAARAGGGGGGVVEDLGEPLRAVRGRDQRDTGSGRPRVGGDAPQRDPTAGGSGGGSGRLGADGGAVLPGQHAGLGQSGEREDAPGD